MYGFCNDYNLKVYETNLLVLKTQRIHPDFIDLSLANSKSNVNETLVLESGQSNSHIASNFKRIVSVLKIL